MPDDRRPDQRFAMIAEELTTEVRANVIEAPSIVRNGGVECPRCGNSAFEPMAALGDGVPRVACLGCPPPAPVYPAPEWAALRVPTNRYRCSQCGEQPWVSATLRDLNLHCRQCKRLTFHSRQVDPAPSPSATSRRPIMTTDAMKLADELISIAQAPLDPEELREAIGDLNYVELSLARQNAFSQRPSTASSGSRERPSVISYQGAIATGDARVGSLTRAMLLTAGLEGFDRYADLRAEENVRNGFPAERRTGRTWRAIFELLALHYLAREANPTRPFHQVLVIGGSESMDRWLRNEVFQVRNRIGNVEPAVVDVMPAAGEVRRGINMLRPPARWKGGPALLYVDHTFYESARRPADLRFDPGLTYKP